ncbi:MAG: ADOP family duplicated permease [Bryobacteraceae bacterium]
MRALEKVRLRLRSLFSRRKLDRELEDELRFHLDQLFEEDVAAGVAPGEAQRSALRKMGGVSQLKEECRDMRRVNYIDDLLRDLWYAGRNLRRSPGFATLAVLIMALGIGANTAVFSVVTTVLLKPLSYRDPDRIVTLSDFSETREASTALSKQVSIPDFQDWHDQNSSFEAMAYYASREAAVMQGSTAEYARVTRVSPEFFRVFAIEPIVGRFFTAEEMKPGSGGALMISYAYWQSRFDGDPRALGQTVRIFGPRPIVGVLPPGFRFPNQTDLWVPAIGGRTPEHRSAQNYLAVARLKPGVSLEQAQTEMAVIAKRLSQQYPASNKGRSVAVTRMRDEMVGDVRLTLYLLLGAVSVVLLIACANTATLLLGKATARTREVAVRAALGASRQRIVRQLITEGLLLAFVAGASGLLLAYWGSKALVAMAPADLPRLDETRIDRWVLAFTLGISMITSLLFGLVPALYASRVDLSDALKQGATRLVGGGGMVRMRGVLVVAEIALAVVLVSGAGLLIKSFVALQNVALGFRPENVLVMRATVPAPPSVGIARARQFFNDMLSQVARLPGVLAAGATMAPPGYVDSTGAYHIDQLPAQPDWTRAPSVVLSIVAPGTFEALGIPLKSGRDFSDGDTLDRPFVAVVNEALVRRSFPNQNPIGRTIFCPFDSLKGMTIIGVAGDVRQRGPEREPMPECYMTYGQHAFNGATLSIVARTSGDPNALAETLRRVARERSPDVPMNFTTMEAILSENVAAPRFRTLLFAVFAGLAVCLAMAGVYGVMAYAVGQRSSEVGLRIALGASAGSVLRLVLGQGLALAGLGLAIGLAAAVTGTRLLTTMLFRVQPNDPVVYLAVAVLLGVVALVASYVPARRASKIDPLTALRQE